MADQELAEVYGDPPVHEVQEDQVVRAALIDPDRQLVRETPDDALAVPQLTHKEKLELDRLLPKTGALTANDLPFELKDAEVEAYWKFYLHYPTYAEFAP